MDFIDIKGNAGWGTPEISGKDEKPLKGAYSQREQVEQSGKRRETEEIHKWVDKLFSICGHEELAGENGRMVTPPNPCSVLETMEKGTNEVQDIKSTTLTRMEGT